MKNVKLSVIVPIYNAVSNGRLSRLLNCLKNQTLEEIEFVLVLDRPTDNSINETIRIVGDDDRFILVENKENLHIGLSRNKGIELSKGYYIAFADDDDMMRFDMYEKMYDLAIETDADIVVSPAIFNDRGKETIEYFDDKSPNLQQYFVNRLSGEISDQEKRLDPYPYLWGNGNMWNKIFKRSIVIDKNIRFVNTRNCCFEDILFQLELFSLTDRIVCDMIPYYTHIYYSDKSNTSITREYNSEVNKINFLSKLIDLYYTYPQIISKDRIEKKVLNMLLPIISRSPMGIMASKSYFMDCFNTFRLYHLIRWYPGFMHEKGITTQIRQLYYVALLKFYLLLCYGKNLCSLRR